MLIRRATRSPLYVAQMHNTASLDLSNLDVANLGHEIVQLLLGLRVLGRHLLVFLFPLLTGLFECRDLTLVVTGLDIGLAEPVRMSQR